MSITLPGFGTPQMANHPSSQSSLCAAACDEKTPPRLIEYSIHSAAIGYGRWPVSRPSPAERCRPTVRPLAAVDVPQMVAFRRAGDGVERSVGVWWAGHSTTNSRTIGSRLSVSENGMKVPCM
jgi:hypothetical protein